MQAFSLMSKVSVKPNGILTWVQIEFRNIQEVIASVMIVLIKVQPTLIS